MESISNKRLSWDISGSVLQESRRNILPVLFNGVIHLFSSLSLDDLKMEFLKDLTKNWPGCGVLIYMLQAFDSFFDMWPLKQMRG